MIRKTIAFIITVLIPVFIYGQIEKMDITNGVTREIYYLDENSLKQNGYTFQYNGRNQVTGVYLDDLKNGKWIYQPDNDFQMIGYYKLGNKDSVWSCYLKGQKYSTQNYITGERRCYFPDGKLRIKEDSINGEYHFIEYSEGGQVIKHVKSDSIFTDRLEYDLKGNIVEHIIFKNGFPYELIKTTKRHRYLVYSGDISKGTGKLETKIKSYKKRKLYLSEIMNLIDSKPNGKYEKFNEKGKVLVSGQYKNGYKVGDWIKYDSKTFKVDTIISYSLSDSIKSDEDENKEEVYFIVEDMPAFNGESHYLFRVFIENNLKYPLEAAEMAIQGRVFVQFAIDWDGKIVDARVVRGVDPILDNEALRVVNLSPYWRPGMQKATPVKVQFTFPISFVLN